MNKKERALFIETKLNELFPRPKAPLNHSNALGLTSTSIYEAYLIGCSIYRFSFKKKFFDLPISDNGVVNLNGDISFRKKNIKPILNNDSLYNNSLQIIYDRLTYEVFKN